MGQESKGFRCGGPGNPKLQWFGHPRIGSLGWLALGEAAASSLEVLHRLGLQGTRASAVVTGFSEQCPSRSGAAVFLPVLPKFLLCIWEAQGKSCIFGFAPSGLGAA